MSFNFNNINNIQFFIKKCIGENEKYYQIKIQDLNDILKEILDATLREFQNTNIEEYSPTEKYNATDRLQISLDSEYARNIKEIYNLNNITIATEAISTNINLIEYYFVQYIDDLGNKLLGIKKATYFKSLTTKRNLLTLYNNSLKPANNQLFKLDNTFDILVYNNEIKIKNYLTFEYISQLSNIVKEKSIENINKIRTLVSFLKFSEESKNYIQSHIMATKLIASISKSTDLDNLNIDNIRIACRRLQIDIGNSRNEVQLNPSNTMDFLKLLDRRLYSVNLTGEEELYEARSKSKK